MREVWKQLQIELDYSPNTPFPIESQNRLKDPSRQLGLGVLIVLILVAHVAHTDFINTHSELRPLMLATILK